jgi:putative flippase GtrA
MPVPGLRSLLLHHRHEASDRRRPERDAVRGGLYRIHSTNCPGTLPRKCADWDGIFNVLTKLGGHRLLKFGLVGVLNTAIDFSLFTFLFYIAGWPLLLANTTGYLAGLVNSYLLNRYWTFRDLSGPTTLGQTALYAAMNLIGLALGNVTVYLLAALTPAWIAKLLTVGITFAWNYFINRRVVFVRS